MHIGFKLRVAFDNRFKIFTCADFGAALSCPCKFTVKLGFGVSVFIRNALRFINKRRRGLVYGLNIRFRF